MKHKLFFLILIVKIALANTVFAGYTLLDKNRLIFSDGGGFDVITTQNTSGQDEMVIRALPYNNSQDSYRAKGIEFKGPSDSTAEDKSIIYKITSQVYTNESECITANPCPREYFMVDKTATDLNIGLGQALSIGDTVSGGMEHIIDADNTYWSVDLQVTSLNSEIDSNDKFNLIIGESSAGFIDTR